MTHTEPFSLAVSNRLRNLNAKLKKAQSERVNLFGERDAILAELDEGAEGAEATELKTKHSDVVLEIERKRKLIKWYGDQISETVDNADKPDLYSEIDTDPEPDPSLFEHRGKKSDAQGDDDAEVGEPDAPGQKTTHAGEVALNDATFPGTFELSRVGKFKMRKTVEVQAATYEGLTAKIDELVAQCGERVESTIVDNDGWQVSCSFADGSSRVVMEIARSGEIPEAVQPGEQADAETGEIKRGRGRPKGSKNKKREAAVAA